MATTTITGTINGVNNTALANKWITFRLVQLGTDSVATATVAQSVDSVQTDANGDFSIGVWNNGDSGKPSVLEITIDGSKAESVIIPTATATIELWDLIENYQADGSTSEQVPTVSALFLRKASNLAELAPTASTARANIGVAIGTNVQAHSAVLDATTASFTTAKDTAISTNTANIASNDTDIATNVTNIATNATGIATNVTAIDLKAPIASPTFTGTVSTSATGIDFNAGNLGGELSWNNTEKTLDLVTGSDSVTIQLGQEVVLYARNTSGATLSDGQVVMISGSQGNNPTIALAQADTVSNARKTIGVVTQIIPNNSNGFVTLQGKVRELVLDNGTYTEGDVVYLSSTVAGGLTDIEPDIGVEIGHVLATSSGGNTNGVLSVQINNGASIHELEQVVNANTAAIALNTAALSGYSPIAIITESTTARSLSLTDIGAYIRLTNASSCTITIPANSTVDWAGETVPPTIYVRVAAAGIPTLSNAGVTINDPLGVIASLAEGSNFELQWVASDVWDII